MPLAVSGFMPSTHKEQLKKKAGSTEDLSAAGKLKAKTEEEKKKKKAKTRKTTTVLLQLNADDGNVKKVSAKKEVSSGGANEHQKVSSNTSSTEVRVSSSTTTEEKERKLRRQLAEATLRVSRRRRNKSASQTTAGQVALDDLEKDKLVISTKVYGEKTEGALVAEKKKKLKAKVDLNGELEAASTEVSKKLNKVTKQTVHRSLGNLLTSDSDINKKDVTFSHDTLLADSSKDTNKKKVKPKTEEVSLDRKLKSENNLVSDPKKSFAAQKLQQRIMGCKDDEDLATEMENKQKCEQRVQLADTGNTKRAMNKWLVMDKEAKSNPLTWRSDEW
uniref:Uncharacterized protein n=1 Tax=Ditylenchus dipsaci TaxID=166011 RepID=A0A915CQY7_9BILA